MIVRNIDDLKTSGNYREKPGVWTSARYLLDEDGVGFTLTQTTVSAGSTQIMEYKNHLEASLIIEGQGELTDMINNQVYQLGPGSMYALDKHDRHQLKAITAMKIVCVFMPALYGPETHDEHGSYPLLNQ